MDYLKFDQIEAEVRRLVAENPDYVYKSDENGTCYYNATGDIEACLFGKVFENLGDPISEDYEQESIVDVLKHKIPDTTRQQRNWASVTQSGQDGEIPWSEALSEADRLYPLRDQK